MSVAEPKTDLASPLAVAPRRSFWPHLLVFPVLALVAAVGLLNALLVPPWQAPDEPQHFEFVRVLTEGGPTEPSQAIQGEILASMWTFDWWTYTRFGTPPKRVPRHYYDEANLPSGIEQIGRQPELYYSLAAAVLERLSAERDVLADLLRLRLLSVALLTLTALGAYLAGLVLFGNPRWAAALGIATGALPMVTYVGSSINNDVLAMAVGAWGFIPIAAIFRRGLHLVPILLAFLFLAIAWMTKTTAFLALGLALALTLGCTALLWLRIWQRLAALLLLVLFPIGFLLGSTGSAEVAGWRFASTNSTGHFAALSHSGERSLSLRRGQQATQFAPIYDLLRLRGSVVELSAYVSGDGKAPGFVEITDGIATSRQPVQPTGEWQAVKLTHTLERAAPFLAVNLIAADEVGTELRFDDVRLVPRGEPGATSLLENGGFEVSRWILRGTALGRTHVLWDLDSQNVQYLLDPTHWRGPALGDYSFLLGTLHQTFWGNFGWVAAPIPSGWLHVIGAMEVAAAAGVFVSLLRARVGAGSSSSIGLLGLIMTTALAFFALIRALPPDPFGGVGIAQGRYLYPGLVPMMAGLLSGWSELLPCRFRQWLPFLVVAGVLTFLAAAFTSVMLPLFFT